MKQYVGRSGIPGAGGSSCAGMPLLAELVSWHDPTRGALSGGDGVDPTVVSPGAIWKGRGFSNGLHASKAL